MTTLQSFRTYEDVANRALQHVGVPAISILGPGGDDTKANTEVSGCFHKLRLAEMRRNTWRFSIRKAVLYPVSTTMMTFTPSTWAIGTTYAAGAIALYNGQIWSSRVSGNIGNTPGADASVDAFGRGVWEPYFGVNVVDVFNPNPTNLVPAPTPPAYYSGDLVYQPNTYAAYAGGTTYSVGQLVSYTDGNNYVSLVNSNTGNTPSSSPSDWAVIGQWSSCTTYASGAVVQLAGIAYVSLQANNVGVQPGLINQSVSAVDWWEISPNQTFTTYRSLYSSNTDTPPTAQWLALSGTLTSFNLLYPVGAGPSEQTATRNVYMLPNGYLRVAPQDPRAGSTSFLGAPSNLQYTDWEFENNYFVTRNSEPIVFRFIADVQDVTLMDDNFCEGWAARIGMEVCEPLTQSVAKIQTIGTTYNRFMSEARVLNALEIGPIEPPADDYITCRI